MTNAALLLQSLSLSLDTNPSVIDRNDGSGVTWSASELVFTSHDGEIEGDADQHDIAVPVTTEELTELHRILTAHLSGRTDYGSELCNEGGYVIVYADHIEVGSEGDGTAEIRMSQADLRSWHTKLTLTLLAAAL